MRNRMQARRGGFTLVEVLIAMVLTAVIGAAVTSVFVNQSAFYDTQTELTEARAVSRAVVNMMTRELRAVETGLGIIKATPDSLSVRVPFAIGVACGIASTGRLHVSVVPVDSAAFADAAFAGYMWRNNATALYENGPGGSTLNTASASDRCIPGGIRTAFLDMNTRARVVSLQSPSSGSVPDGAPILLYQVVTYYFAPSTEVPGTRGLRRRDGARNEELAAPFDASARFRYYGPGSATAQDAPPTPLSDLRGVELVLTGRSDRPGSDGAQQQTPFTTAIFFRNRAD